MIFSGSVENGQISTTFWEWITDYTFSNILVNMWLKIFFRSIFWHGIKFETKIVWSENKWHEECFIYFSSLQYRQYWKWTIKSKKKTLFSFFCLQSLIKVLINRKNQNSFDMVKFFVISYHLKLLSSCILQNFT